MEKKDQRRNSVSQNQVSSETKFYLPLPRAYWVPLHPRALIKGIEDENDTKKIRIVEPKDYKFRTIPEMNLIECDTRLIKLYILNLLHYQLSEDRLSGYELSPCLLEQEEYFQLVSLLRPNYPRPQNYDQVMRPSKESLYGYELLKKKRDPLYMIPSEIVSQMKVNGLLDESGDLTEEAKKMMKTY
jgi:hypothetical protein